MSRALDGALSRGATLTRVYLHRIEELDRTDDGALVSLERIVADRVQRTGNEQLGQGLPGSEGGQGRIAISRRSVRSYFNGAKSQNSRSWC
jgi:hypothetical protein